MPKVSEEYFENKKEDYRCGIPVFLEKTLSSIVMQDITDKTGFSNGDHEFGVLSKKDRYNPDEMFSCLANSLISMIGGTNK